jgi:hypothetical protein
MVGFLLLLAYGFTSPLAVPPEVGSVLTLMPFETLKIFPGWKAVTILPVVGSVFQNALPLRILAVLGLFALGQLVTLLGLFIIRLTGGLQRSYERFLAAFSVVGLGATLLLGQKDGGIGVQGYFWAYVTPCATGLGVVGISRLSQLKPRWLRHFAAAGLVVVGGLSLVTTLALAYVPFGDITAGQISLSPAQADLPPDLLAALIWVRQNTAPAEILAVNNQVLVGPSKIPAGYATDTTEPAAWQFYYSAFTERRIFLEGYVYSLQDSSQGRTATQAVIDARRILVRRLFESGDGTALVEMRNDYGVKYLFVDKRVPTQLPQSQLELLFSNPLADVYRVAEP